MNLAEARSALAARASTRRGAVALSFEDEGQTATICIDHPSARSALSLSMMCDLADVVARLASWEGRLILLYSSDPRSFCSGGDLSDVVSALSSPDDAAEMSRAMSAVLAALKDNPAISVAAVDGAAIGGGAELSTATDFRVAGPEARFQFVQGRLGIAPGWGGTARLVQIIGRQNALRLLLSARAVGPGEAVSLGLADHRCDGSALIGARTWLDALFAMPLVSVRAIKRQVVAADPVALCPEEIAAFAGLWGGEAHRAALAAIERQKR